MFALSLALPGAWPVRGDDARVSIEPRARSAGATGEADRSSPDFTVDSNLVLIPVMVTDQEDRLITGLERTQFRVWEDKVEQVITHFASEDLPVSTSFLIDRSGSMGQKLQKSKAAVNEFLKTANPEDEFSVIQFGDRAEVVSDFTSRPEELQSRMLFTGSRGCTALLDAVMLSLNEMKHARHSRKAILIISDGGDNCSRYSWGDVKKRLREADVQVYSIGVLEPPGSRGRTPEETLGPALLNAIAEQTGGRLFELNDTGELSEVAAKIAIALRNQYVLGYAPSAPKRDGKYHRVQVKITQPKGLPSLRIFSRTGYLAPSH
jgi:VWFA-related protein